MNSDSETLMKWTELILEYMRWPFTAIVIAIIFKGLLSKLLGKINFFKYQYGDSSVEASISKDETELTDTPPHSMGKGSLQNSPIEDEKPIDRYKIEESSWLVDAKIEVTKGNIEEAKALFLKYSSANRDEVEVHNEKSFFLFLIYDETNDQNVLSELERHSNNAPNDQCAVRAAIWYVVCLEQTKNYKTAFKYLNETMKRISDQLEITRVIVRIAKLHLFNSEPHMAKDIIINRLEVATIDQEKHILYKFLSDTEFKLDNKRAAVLCLDKALEYKTDDTDIMFKSAYEASKIDLKSIEVSNYDTLVNLDKKNAIALNNFGVSATNEGLKIISVDYYTNASELNETLSMANLGQKLLNEGFASQAEELANKAIETGNTHENIYALLNEIKKSRDNENKKWEEYKTKYFDIQKKLRNYTSALYNRNKILNIEGNWITEKGIPVNIQMLDENTFDIRIKDNDEDIKTYIVGSTNNNSFHGVYIEDHTKKSTTLLSSEKRKSIMCSGYIDKHTSKIIFFSEDIKKEFELSLSRQHDSDS